MIDTEAIIARAEHYPAARAYVWLCRLLPRPIDEVSLAKLMDTTVDDAREVIRVVEELRK